jgi:hypothetical protein
MDFENDHNISTSGFEAGYLRSGSSRPMQCYEIRFKGHLDDHWAAWFQGCSLTRKEDGTTTMVAPVVDQAELYGLLNKVRDLSLALISVREVKSNDDSSLCAKRFPK